MEVGRNTKTVVVEISSSRGCRDFKNQHKYIETTENFYISSTDKNGKKNYVGGSTFLELYEAFMENKKIYLWNEIPEGILFDEISGFAPEIINGKLDLVK